MYRYCIIIPVKYRDATYREERSPGQGAGLWACSTVSPPIVKFKVLANTLVYRLCTALHATATVHGQAAGVNEKTLKLNFTFLNQCFYSVTQSLPSLLNRLRNTLWNTYLLLLYILPACIYDVRPLLSRARIDIMLIASSSFLEMGEKKPPNNLRMNKVVCHSLISCLFWKHQLPAVTCCSTVNLAGGIWVWK